MRRFLSQVGNLYNVMTASREGFEIAEEDIVTEDGINGTK